MERKAPTPTSPIMSVVPRPGAHVSPGGGPWKDHPHSGTLSKVRAAFFVAVLVAFTGCSDGGDDPRAEPGDQGKTEAPGAAIDVGGAPRSFYAVWDHGTEIVEVETATGRVVRTVIDVGPYRQPRADGGEEPNTSVSELDLAPDGRTLWYSTGPPFRNGSVFQLALPEGTPEQMAVGHDPSVSPDGRRLAWVDGTTIRIRDLGGGTEQTLQTEALSPGGVRHDLVRRCHQAGLSHRRRRILRRRHCRHRHRPVHQTSTRRRDAGRLVHAICAEVPTLRRSPRRRLLRGDPRPTP